MDLSLRYWKVNKNGSLGLQERLKAAALNERPLSHHRGEDHPNLASELPLSDLVGLGLGSALGYRSFGLLKSYLVRTYLNDEIDKP